MNKFTIFSLDRSGSTLLGSLLNAHPAIHCDGELFNPDHWRARPQRWLLPWLQHYPRPYIGLRTLAAAYGRRVAAYGFKLKMDQLAATAAILARLQRNGWQLLYLERLSLFDQTISALVASHTNRYHQRVGAEESLLAPFVIPPSTFQAALQSRVARLRQCELIVATLPHLKLVYEEDLQAASAWAATVACICTYLHLPLAPTPVTTTLRKTWRQPYCELISNYTELQAIAESEPCLRK